MTEFFYSIYFFSGVADLFSGVADLVTRLPIFTISFIDFIYIIDFDFFNVFSTLLLLNS